VQVRWNADVSKVQLARRREGWLPSLRDGKIVDASFNRSTFISFSILPGNTTSLPRSSPLGHGAILWASLSVGTVLVFAWPQVGPIATPVPPVPAASATSATGRPTTGASPLIRVAIVPAVISRAIATVAARARRC
jgi:hypothetical protein